MFRIIVNTSVNRNSLSFPIINTKDDAKKYRKYKLYPYNMNASEFFFDDNANWTSLSEIRLNDANGKSADNIAYDLLLCKFHSIMNSICLF
jgi:hypothetical protein